MDNIQEGDIIISFAALTGKEIKRKVLARIKNLVAVSLIDDHDSFQAWFTITELKRLNYHALKENEVLPALNNNNGNLLH